MSETLPCRLLIVEDDPFYAELVRAAASPLFAEVLLAEGGNPALALLAQRAAASLPLPDIILTDLKMPALDGLGLLREIQKEPALARIPVVVMTSSSIAADREAAERAGCRFFFQKPERVRSLMDILRRLPELCHDSLAKP